jgi:asparagine synthase (glutamine-hydrolysing)
MINLITGSIATNPTQLIGYWGYGDFETQTAQLKQLLTPTPTNWCISPLPANVALSADGLAHNPHCNKADVWVQITEQKLQLGRQAFGRVPLYWLQIEQVIWFASRLQLLLPLVTPKVSIPALYGYSCLSYVPTPLTPIEQIAALPAGTEQIWMEKRGVLSLLLSHSCQEWSETSSEIDDEQEAIRQLQSLLKAAVARQIADIGNETVGVFLSGGLDSSIVAALLVQAGVKVRAYCLDFGETAISEYAYAEQVANWLKIPLVKVEVTPRQLQAALIPTIKALDLPFGDGVTVPFFLLNQAASRDTSIVFNGEGGDQLFAGWTNKPLIAASIYQSEHPGSTFEAQYLQTFHRLWGYEAQVFQKDVYAEIQQLNPQDWLYPALDDRSSLLHRLRRASLMLKGAQNIHPRATNLAFAHGLRVRSPFCDLPLTNWTFHLSGKLLLQGACEKYILKRAAESWLPPEIVWRQKRGMGVPLTSWCLNQWWRELGIWLNPAILQAEARWQPDLATRIAFGELGGKIQGRRIGEILWLLIVWQLWRVEVLGDATVTPAWRYDFLLPYQFWRFAKRWR